MREITQAPISKNTLLIRPTFIKGSDCFYYSFQTGEGKKYYWVDPKRKEKRLLFDNAELVSKVSEMTRKPYNHRNFDIEVKFLDEETFKFYLDRQDYTYNIRTKELKLWKAKKQFTSDPYWCIILRIVLICCLPNVIICIWWVIRRKVRIRQKCSLRFDGEKELFIEPGR